MVSSRKLPTSTDSIDKAERSLATDAFQQRSVAGAGTEAPLYYATRTWSEYATWLHTVLRSSPLLGFALRSMDAN